MPARHFARGLSAFRVSVRFARHLEFHPSSSYAYPIAPGPATDRYCEEHKPMPSQAQTLTSMFRIIVLVAVTALLITSAALPMSAQNTVPPTAVQAAKMPQFASRLVQPASRAASRPNPTPARQGSSNRPPQGNVLYENGPINGNTDAWIINFDFIVSDTFTVSGDSTVTGMSFGAWLLPGDTLTSAQISITSEPNGGTTYFDQTVNFTQGICASNSYGYNVCTETSANFSTALTPGTYWVNLQNASVPTGDPVYWDENSGVGCQSPGCPSQGYENSVGSIPSESFTLLGSSGPPTCGADGNPQGIPSLARPQAGASGPIIRNAGNYRPTYIGSEDGAGLARHWWEKVLHNFGSGVDGIQPDYGSLIHDSSGNLYGTTVDGGTHGCGMAFELSPGEGGWTETVLHNFNNDGVDGYFPQTGLIFDTAGNLYGTTQYGPRYGTVFELSPAQGGGWTEKVLYAFTGPNDGRYPRGLTFDSSGNLFGTTSNGGIYCSLYQGCGTVFELSPAQGGGWTETVLHSFGDGTDGDNPLAPLILDSAGNLYGTTSGGGVGIAYGTVFELSPAQGGGWTLTTLYSFGVLPDGQQPWTGPVAFDSAGNLYGTTAFGGTNRNGTVFELSPNGSGGWMETVLHSFGSGMDGVEPLGSVIVDADGNLYGTTSQGGLDGGGTVFEFSPDGSGGWTETILHSFVGTDGAYPFAGLTFGAAGNLYGTTGLAGPYSGGTAFELTPVFPCPRCSHAGLP